MIDAETFAYVLYSNTDAAFCVITMKDEEEQVYTITATAGEPANVHRLTEIIGRRPEGMKIEYSDVHSWADLFRDKGDELYREFPHGSIQSIPILRSSDRVGSVYLIPYADTEVNDHVIPGDMVSLYSELLSAQRENNLLRNTIEKNRVSVVEIRHRTMNLLQIVSSIFSLQAMSISDANSLTVIENTRQRLNSIIMLYDFLDSCGAVDTASVKTVLTDIVEALIASCRYSVVEFTSVEVEDVTIPNAVLIPLGQVITELVMNSVQHAFPKNRKGAIEISIKKVKSSLEITIADNGVGLPPEFDIERSGGLGFDLVRTLIRRLEGTMRVTGREPGGTEFMIHLPIIGEL